MRYIDLMGGQKPHLLVKTKNNLGAETEVQYAPSTKFYLADKLEGKPWITRMPFPVHCVIKVTAKDKWRKTAFTTKYSYHHGYFDGSEREFRGFGRMEQVDTESYGEFIKGNSTSLYISDDQTLYQPPVKTVTWYHTGASMDPEHILSQYRNEYFPKWFEDLRPNEINVLGEFQEHVLPEVDLEGDNLIEQEWREALRACKGMMLRQEVYELDVDALESGREVPVRLFTTAFHNCNIKLIQPKANNSHAVFHVSESEAITYHYELDLRPTEITPDPRIAHKLNLKLDDYGNAQQSVAAVYKRRNQYTDNTLKPEDVDLINELQGKDHLAYTENRYTKDDVYDSDHHRLPVACQSRNYEITGINPLNGFFSIEQLRNYKLSDFYKDNSETVKEAVPEIKYHEIADGETPQKRLVEETRILYFEENLKKPLSFGALNRLGLPYETYRLAMTDSLLTSIFKDKLTAEVQERLADSGISGYMSGDDLIEKLGTDTSGQYWVRSGIAGFAEDAAQHFYLPECFNDPFGNETRINFDPYDLYIKSSTDPVENTVSVKQYDFRVLAPREMVDMNGNHTEVWFDALGMVVASAVKGKKNNDLWQGDNLEGFTDELANPLVKEASEFCTNSVMDEPQAREWLGNAGTRFVYHFGETIDSNNTMVWNEHMAGACSIVREKHVGQIVEDELSPLQVYLECSDGIGNVLIKKVQVEPDPLSGNTLRWIVNGLTVLNNKGKPVKQYEPAFTINFGCEEPQTNGVAIVMYYDAVGRLIRTELPDGSYSRTEFSPWFTAAFDPNDTVLEPDNAWYGKNTEPTASEPARRAAQLAAEHAATPAVTHLDSLGREVVAIAHNHSPDGTGAWVNEKYLTFTRLDAEGKPLWIRDARGNRVMQYVMPPIPDGQPDPPLNEIVPCYDIAGNLLYQHSMDAGDRWMLNDVTGQPLYSWDSRGNILQTTYDELRRPKKIALRNSDHAQWIVVGFTQYGDEPDITEAAARNLRGQAFRSFDQSGLLTSQRFDFKGNPLEVRRRLAQAFTGDTDWNEAEDLTSDNGPGKLLMAETYTQIMEYDALNRIIRQYVWHKGVGSRVYVIEPYYNERGLMQKENLILGAVKTDVGAENGISTEVVKAVQYNEKGQRVNITYGNDVTTIYEYDDNTFRLIHLKTQRSSDSKKLQDFYYTYDPSGNITEILDRAQPTVFFNNFQVNPENKYTYDALYRLVEASGREHAGQVVHDTYDNWHDCYFRKKLHPNDAMAWQNYTELYVYDSVGNILSMKHVTPGSNANTWTRHYQYARFSNRLLATGMKDVPTDTYVDAPTLEYQYPYNAHGSMIAMPNLSLMQWDFTEHLHHIARTAGTINPEEIGCPDASVEAWYRYDATKQRTRKRVLKNQGAIVEERFYLGGFEIFRRSDAEGNIQLESEALHVMDDKQSITLIETKTVDIQTPSLEPKPLMRYQLGNHLGSVGLELDDVGDVISYEEYYPYGNTCYQAMQSGVEVSLKRYRYTGMERDDETGLNYHGSRYYAMRLGRWLSCDPAGLVDGDNIFLYVQASPVRFTDPGGQQLAGPESRALQRIEFERMPSGRLRSTEKEKFIKEAKSWLSWNGLSDALVDRLAESVEAACGDNLQLQNYVFWHLRTYDIEMKPYSYFAPGGKNTVMKTLYHSQININELWKSHLERKYEIRQLGAKLIHEVSHGHDKNAENSTSDPRIRSLVEGPAYAIEYFLLKTSGNTQVANTVLTQSINAIGSGQGFENLFREEWVKKFSVLNELYLASQGKSDLLPHITREQAKEWIASYIARDRDSWSEELKNAERTVQSKIDEIAKRSPEIGEMMVKVRQL